MGHRTSIKNPRLTKRLPLEEAETVFLNHCRIKNLSPRTIQYYQEDLEYFFAHLEGIRYADEITREVFEDFLIKQVDAGKKTTSLNTRIRGLRVFFKFCAEREYGEIGRWSTTLSLRGTAPAPLSICTSRILILRR